MIIPTRNGRAMKKIKEYSNFVLFEDEKTGIKECFRYFDLGMQTPQLKYWHKGYRNNYSG